MRTVLNLERIYSVNKRLARVTATTNRIATLAEYQEILSERYNGRIQMVPGTVTNVSVGQRPMVSAFVVLQNNSMDMEQASMNEKGMKVVTANVFSDNEDNIWKVVDMGEGNKRLVQTSDDDIEALLNYRRGRLASITTASFEPSVDFSNGQYVTYVNASTGTVSSGVGLIVAGADKVNKYMALDRRSRQPVEISDTTFVSATDFGDEDGEMQPFEFSFSEVASAGLSPQRAKEAIEYYRILYGEQPNFFNKLEQLILALTIN